MSVAPVPPGTPVPVEAPRTAAAQARIDYDAFLTLLVTEMRNQDPTKPMDSTEFVSQLATFSGVEQAVQTNAKLDALLTAAALDHAAAIGRHVETADGAGTVAAIRVSGGAVEAVLTDGSRLSLADGWTLREAA